MGSQPIFIPSLALAGTDARRDVTAALLFFPLGRRAMCASHLCGRGMLMCRAKDRGRSDRPWRIGNLHILMWGLGGTGPGLYAFFGLGWKGCVRRFGRGGNKGSKGYG